MKKEGINYILINSTFFIFCIFLLNKLNILNSIINIVLLIILSIILAYIAYPIYKKISNKYISIIMVFIIILLIIILFLYLIIPNKHMINNLIKLFNNVMIFMNKIEIKYSLNININSYVEKLANYFISNSVYLLKNALSYISKMIFVIILSICILININHIKELISKYKYKKLIYNIHIKLQYYLIANVKILCIQFIEYTVIFMIIGHPNYLLLGILNSLNTFIPYVGSMITNIIAIITASIINKKLLFFTSIISIVMPQIDAYFITPKIYKQSNEIPQTLYIITMIIMGSLFKIWGVIISLPALIIVIEIIKYKNIVKNN